MTIQLQLIFAKSAYELKLYDLLVKVEGREYSAYIVNNLSTGVPEPHIGIGFKITEDPALAAVIRAFGINIPGREGLTPVQQARELSYENLIRQKVLESFSSNSALQSALNQIMYDRSKDTLNTPGRTKLMH